VARRRCFPGRRHDRRFVWRQSKLRICCTHRSAPSTKNNSTIADRVCNSISASAQVFTSLTPLACLQLQTTPNNYLQQNHLRSLPLSFTFITCCSLAKTLLSSLILIVQVDDSYNDQMNRDLARRAVSIIAKHRMSDILESWLTTGEMTSQTMSLEDACKHLEIPNLDEVVPEMIELQFEMVREGKPGSTTDKAIAIVRKAMHERQFGQHTTQSWPVGLISHGNTCYLNSLLQYYFTIKPLRELVLDFDKFKYDLETQGAKAERVGNLHRPEYEIGSFQSLTNDLRHLFQRMIRDRGPAVKPEADLVCRAFLKPTSPEADTTGSQQNEAVDVNMTSTETEDHPAGEAVPGNVDDSSTVSQVNSNTLQGDAALTPPATPKVEKEGELLAPPLPPRRPATPSQQTKTNLEKAEEAARQQQDVAEVMEELLTRLRASIKPLGKDAQGEQIDQLREYVLLPLTKTIVLTLHL
jgi:ubiquitin carboxyl-terminal hydrolase 25/28